MRLAHLGIALAAAGLALCFTLEGPALASDTPADNAGLLDGSPEDHREANLDGPNGGNPGGVVPEPGTLALLGLGLAALGVARARRKGRST